jgi:cytochrome c551/c552
MKWFFPAAVALTVLTACNEKKAEAPPAPPPEPVAEVKPPEPAKVEMKVPELVVSTDAAAIATGKDLFASKGCIACHKIGGGKLVGPDLKGVTARRDTKWLSKMILYPEVMVKEDEVAKKLFVEHLVPMPNQAVDAQKELPFLLAFLKSNET